MHCNCFVSKFRSFLQYACVCLAYSSSAMACSPTAWARVLTDQGGIFDRICEMIAGSAIAQPSLNPGMAKNLVNERSTMTLGGRLRVRLSMPSTKSANASSMAKVTDAFLRAIPLKAAALQSKPVGLFG